MDATVLSVSGVSKRFGPTLALKGVDLGLARGEWLGLLGPNGAGKTTLVKAIAGRVRPDSGSITLLGRRVETGIEAGGSGREGLGVVPQEIAVYPLLTARENLEVFGKLYAGGAAAPERVSWALEWTGLADRAKEPVKNFSGGMKRRLNIACAVLHKPEVVLLDEPTVGVDPQSRERIWEMLSELRAGGTSLLLTTHQLDEAQRLCDRIVIIDHGSVIADGTFEDLVARTIGTGRTVILALDREVEPGTLNGALETAGRVVRSRG